MVRSVGRALVLLACLLAPVRADAAIALDTQMDCGIAGGGAGVSCAYTMGSGSGGLIAFGMFGETGGASGITGATFNGTALTQIASVQVPGDRWIELWYLLAPTSGTHTAAITCTGVCDLQVVSYTGVGAFDTSGTQTGSSVASITTTLTVGTNAWIVSVGKTNSGNPAWTGATSRINASGMSVADSNGPLSGSQNTTLANNFGTNGNFALISGSFTPSGGGGGAAPCRLLLLGVGCGH